MMLSDWWKIAYVQRRDSSTTREGGGEIRRPRRLRSLDCTNRGAKMVDLFPRSMYDDI